jgi:hypothetical protein
LRIYRYFCLVLKRMRILIKVSQRTNIRVLFRKSAIVYTGPWFLWLFLKIKIRFKLNSLNCNMAQIWNIQII